MVGKEHPEVLSPVLTSLAELRGSANFSLEGEVDHVVGRAVAAMGPARLFAAIPLNITGRELEVMLIVNAFSFSTGLEKTRVFLKKPSPVGFFGFFWVFWVFWVFLGFFCPDERVFRVFQFYEYF